MFLLFSRFNSFEAGTSLLWFTFHWWWNYFEKKNVYHVQFVSSSLQGFEVRCQEYKWRIAVGVQEEAERIKLGAWSSATFYWSMNDGHYPKKRNKKGLNCFSELGPISSKQETLIFHYWMVADDQALRNRYIYMLLICTCSSKKIIYTRWTTMKKDSNIPNLMTKVCLYVE